LPHELGVLEAIYNSRAMRRLKPDPVPEDILIKLVDAGNHAPSGSNSQNARWIIVRDPDQKAKLAELNRRAVMAAYAGPSSAPPASLPHQSAEKRRRMMDAVMWQAEHLQEVPALIIACLQFPSRPNNSFAAGAGAAGSIWPGVQNVLLAARALGLGAAPTTLGLADRPAAKAALGLPDEIEPFCLIPVGYPTGNFGPVVRRPIHEVMRWDRWS
jgi:nitroreductase